MKKGVLIGTIAVIVLAGGWFLYEKEGGFSLEQERDEGVQPSGDIKKEIQGGSTESVDAGKERYINEKYGFSFVYPETFSVSMLPELGGESILVRGADTEFQIFVSPFDEEGPITPARIRQDLPDLIIKEPQQVLIGEDKDIEALIFLGESEEFGSTREVWFVQGGNLYQVIAEAGYDDVVGPVLESLRFQAE